MLLVRLNKTTGLLRQQLALAQSLKLAPRKTIGHARDVVGHDARCGTLRLRRAARSNRARQEPALHLLRMCQIKVEQKKKKGNQSGAHSIGLAAIP